MPVVSHPSALASREDPRRPHTGLRGLTRARPFLVIFLHFAVLLGSGALPAQTPFVDLQLVDSLPFAGSPSRLDVGELNGNGRPEVFVSGPAWQLLEVWYDGINPTFTPWAISSPSIAFAGGAAFLDGSPQRLVVTGGDSQTGNGFIEVHAVSGTLTLTLESTAPVTGSITSSPVLLDLDGDGDEDLVCISGYNNPSTLEVYLWDETSNPPAFTFSQSIPVSSLVELAVANHDGLGGDDVIALTQSSIRWLEGLGNGMLAPFAQSVGSSPGIGSSSLDTGDLNSDGVLDYVVFHQAQCCGDPGLRVYASPTHALTGYFPNEFKSIGGVGDLDLDGYDDVIVGAANAGMSLILTDPTNAPNLLWQNPVPLAGSGASGGGDAVVLQANAGCFPDLLVARSTPNFLALYVQGAASTYDIIAVNWAGTAFQIDSSIGMGWALGATGFSTCNAMARDALGQIWVVAGPGSPALITVDPSTGIGTSMVMTTGTFDGLAFSPSGTLFAIAEGAPSDLLYTIDVSTGVASLVGAMTGFVSMQGLAFSPSGTLYGWDIASGLVVIDPTSAATTDVDPGPLGTAQINCLAFSPSGELYGARNELYTIDLVTGAPSLVGSCGYNDVRGIEFFGTTTIAPPTWFEGISHTALGDALLQVQPGASGAELSVSNIGSSGQDGVTLDLGQVAGIMMDGPLHLTPVGSTLSFAPEGLSLSSPVALGALVATRNSNMQLELTVDLSQTGATTFDVEILDGGCPVLQAPGLASLQAAVIGPLGGGADRVDVSIRENVPGVNEIVYTWALEAAAMIDVPGSPSVMGEEVHFTYVDPAPDAITAVSLTGLNPDPMVPMDLVITEERIAFFDACHRALGSTRFDTITTVGSLRLYELDEGMSSEPKYALCGGTEMPEFWSGATAAVGWDALDPMGMLPFGASAASLEWKAVGDLGGLAPEELASITSTKQTATEWDTVVDWTLVPSASLNIQVWNGTTQVLALNAPSTSPFSVLAGAPSGIRMSSAPFDLAEILGVPSGVWIDGPSSIVAFPLPDSLPLSIGGTTVTVTGDLIVVEASPPVMAPASINRLELLTTSISELTLTSAEVSPLPFSLSFDQDPVTLDLDIAIDGARPSSPYFIFYAFDPLNGTAAGMGPWGGLWITVPELVDQLQYGFLGIPIFGGTLDACGQMASTIPGLPSLPGLTVYSVALTFDGGGNWLFSEVEVLMLN